MQVSLVRATVRMAAIASAGILSLAVADPPSDAPAPPAPAPAVEAPDVTQTRPPAASAPAATAPAPTATLAAATSASAATPSEHAAKPAGPEEDQFERHLRAEGYVVRVKDGERLFCKRDVNLGTRLMSAYTCATKEALEARETQDQREAADAQQRARTGYGQVCMGSGGRATSC